MYWDFLYNWNLLQYLGRDPQSYVADYRRMVELSLEEGGPATISRSRTRTESRRSDNHASKRFGSSVIQPSTFIQAAIASQEAPTVDPARATPPREVTQISDDSESVSKRTRAD